jgi:hypothetical protein
MSAGMGCVDAPDRLRVVLDLVEQSLDEPTWTVSSRPTAAPQTFSLGGVLAHVLPFSAVRRTMAIGALDTADSRTSVD